MAHAVSSQDYIRSLERFRVQNFYTAHFCKSFCSPLGFPRPPLYCPLSSSLSLSLSLSHTHTLGLRRRPAHMRTQTPASLHSPPSLSAPLPLPLSLSASLYPQLILSPSVSFSPPLPASSSSVQLGLPGRKTAMGAGAAFMRVVGGLYEDLVARQRQRRRQGQMEPK